MFGFTQSRIILKVTLDADVTNCWKEFQDVVETVRYDIHVDDLVTGGENINEIKKLKSESISLFWQGRFKLHKWHSNELILDNKNQRNTAELSFAKQQLGTKASKKNTRNTL